jgi:hypothetical protein
MLKNASILHIFYEISLGSEQLHFVYAKKDSYECCPFSGEGIFVTYGV